MVRECRIGHVDGLAEAIDRTILINHESKDCSLIPSSKNKRVRGKKVLVNGKEVKMRGDSIRGRLHEESFLGAITQNQQDEVFYVMRRNLAVKRGETQGFTSWDDLEKQIVNKSLIPMMKSQFPEGTTFAEAFEQGIYMLDNEGNKVNRIRRIRCHVAAKNPAKVKVQTYPSSKEYKNYYYAVNGEIAAYAIYWDGKIGSNRDYASISIMDLAKIKNTLPIVSKEEAFETTLEQPKGGTLPLFAVLVPGRTKVLVFRNDEFEDGTSIDNIKHLAATFGTDELSKRLYIVRQVFSKDGRVRMIHHLEARDDKKLEKDYGLSGKNGFSDIDINQPQPKLLLSKGNLTILVEGKHFIIDGLGNIVFND